MNITEHNGLIQDYTPIQNNIYPCLEILLSVWSLMWLLKIQFVYISNERYIRYRNTVECFDMWRKYGVPWKCFPSLYCFLLLICFTYLTRSNSITQAWSVSVKLTFIKSKQTQNFIIIIVRYGYIHLKHHRSY